VSRYDEALEIIEAVWNEESEEVERVEAEAARVVGEARDAVARLVDASTGTEERIDALRREQEDGHSIFSLADMAKDQKGGKDAVAQLLRRHHEIQEEIAGLEQQLYELTGGLSRDAYLKRVEKENSTTSLRYELSQKAKKEESKLHRALEEQRRAVASWSAKKAEADQTALAMAGRSGGR
jgi:hypothetical protein